MARKTRKNATTKPEAKEPETVVTVAKHMLPVQQTVWRSGHSALYMWESGGTFKDDESGVHGEFGSVLPGCTPLVIAKWRGVDGTEQSANFTVPVDAIIKAVIDCIVSGIAEERRGGSSNGTGDSKRALLIASELLVEQQRDANLRAMRKGGAS